MAAFMLESLVLHGSARLGVLGYLRLGRSVVAAQIPGVVSTQPLPGKRPDNPNPNGALDATKGSSPGAGRSRRHAGSLCQGTATLTATRWWLSGGQARAAAAKHQALWAGFVASANEVRSVGIFAAHARGRQEGSR
jgi:hypothetical protein